MLCLVVERIASLGARVDLLNIGPAIPFVLVWLSLAFGEDGWASTMKMRRQVASLYFNPAFWARIHQRSC